MEKTKAPPSAKTLTHKKRIQRLQQIIDDSVPESAPLTFTEKIRNKFKNIQSKEHQIQLENAAHKAYEDHIIPVDTLLRKEPENMLLHTVTHISELIHFWQIKSIPEEVIQKNLKNLFEQYFQKDEENHLNIHDRFRKISEVIIQKITSICKELPQNIDAIQIDPKASTLNINSLVFKIVNTGIEKAQEVA